MPGGEHAIQKTLLLIRFKSKRERKSIGHHFPVPVVFIGRQKANKIFKKRQSVGIGVVCSGRQEAVESNMFCIKMGQ